MLTLSGWITAQVPSASRSASDARAARTGTAEQAENPAAGTEVEVADQHVRLSQAGRELAATMGAPVEEDEDIPQELRPMVKMIRELKKKIEEKLRELREAMRSSDPGTKEARVPALQKELQQLNSALQTATAAMASAIKEMGISDPALVMKVMGSR
ncbi:TPA: hypothetical protein OUI23_004075 [Pseudomonas aeruginosa]|nr:hypothetical protein [Pseudomonas aeruginosa]